MSNSFPNHGDLQGWTDFLQDGEPPVLNSTQNTLSAMKLNDDTLLPVELSVVILRDPLFAAAVLRHMQSHRNKLRNTDITTIEHALMMLGIEPFYRIFGMAPTIAEIMPGNVQARQALMSVARRSYVASRVAQDWAAKEKDIESEELQVAALIHDVAEMLLWVRAPGHALLIQHRMDDNLALRSSEAQQEILGVSLVDIAIEICKNWGMPDILLELLSAKQGEPQTARMRTVSLAVRLARHCAYGWSNPALPLDWVDIATHLRFSSPESAQVDIEPYVDGLMKRWDTHNEFHQKAAPFPSR